MNLPDARLTFADLPVVHVGTLDADGAPHVVPLWFVWLDEGVYVTCRGGSRVLANLRRDARVALQFDRGRTWPEHLGVMLTGRAELLAQDHPSIRGALSAWFEKYRPELSGPAFAAYSEQVEEPAMFRVRPERLSGWMHASRGRG
jgi:nitroimidazol reductase NimA-like FMN-containing flavoprotein (pyridoxamine 5'-phosphate oxidase superfamily)